jgi:Cu(I)/Ag(I) efflux system periplasmic protein CusF
MKLVPLSISLALALGASAAYAQGGHAHGATEPPPCCETTGAKGYKASGVVKKVDPAKSTVTVAHGPVKELKWPAMTMAFKVKDKGVLDKLPVDRKVDFTFVQEGKDYLITAVQ